MKDLVAVVIIAIVLGLAVLYIVRAKKKGVKCIGCPSGGNCCSSNEENCSCCGCGEKK